MKTNFDCVGCSIETEEQLDTFFETLVDESADIETPYGKYKVAKDDNGAEFWLGIKDEEYAGANPIFISGLNLEVEFDESVPDKWHDEIEANLAISIFKGDELITRAQVTTANMPAVLGTRKEKGFLGLPKTVKVPTLDALSGRQQIELSLLALEPVLFNDAEDYQSSLDEASNEPQFAVGSFIATGMFATPAEPDAYGIGKIIKTETYTGLFGSQYYWAQVEFLDLAINITWPSEATREPKPGDIIQYGGRVMAKVIWP